MKKTIAFVLLSASFVLQAKSANEVLVTEARLNRGAKALSLEVESDGSASTFQMFVNVPGATEKDVDLSRCLSGLPKTHVGGCVFKNGQIRLGAYSQSLALLPAGVLRVGMVVIRRSDAAKAITVSDVELGDSRGMPIASGSKFAADVEK